MSLSTIKYQQLSYTVEKAGQEITIDAETDKLYAKCTGINAVISNEAAKYSHLQLKINSKEIFPENWEILRVKFPEGSPFGYEYSLLDEPAAGSKISGKYTDKAQAVYPYTLTISLRLENPATE